MMTSAEAAQSTADPAAADSFDAVVVGAGFAGMYMMHRLRAGSTSRAPAGTRSGKPGKADP